MVTVALCNASKNEIAEHYKNFIVNDYEIYRQSTEPTIRTLKKKAKNGNHDEREAMKLYTRIARQNKEKYFNCGYGQYIKNLLLHIEGDERKSYIKKLKNMDKYIIDETARLLEIENNDEIHEE